MMRIVALGDSIVWGQGLLTDQKFTTLVHTGLNGNAQDGSLTVLAHSGATIGVGATIGKPALDGEVPDSYPTIIQQCDSFNDQPQYVDVVIVNGGINDLGGFNIVNPLTDEDDLREKINQHCYRDMLTLLTNVTAKFSSQSTKIVVPGYHLMLSPLSDPIRLPGFLGVHGVQLTRFLTDLGDIVFSKIYKQCQMFYDLSNAGLTQAVNETNQALGRQCVRFAQAPFTPDNAALAPTAWLWGGDADTEPDDPVAQQRHAACDLYETDVVQREICYRASAGHPNIVGAQQFANAILAALA
jgi:lysophospholipase L1-like esterase